MSWRRCSVSSSRGFTAGVLALDTTARRLGLSLPRRGMVIEVPRFVAIRRVGGEPLAARPRTVCVIGSHWSGSADVGSWLAHALNLDFSHVGHVASRAYLRLTHTKYNYYDRDEVSRTYVLGSELIGRRRVWACGGEHCLPTFEMLSDPALVSEPHVVYLRATDHLMRWTSRTRVHNGHCNKNTTAEADLFQMRDERRVMDEVLARSRSMRRRTIVIPADLPPGVDVDDIADDGRDAFTDLWGQLAERALIELSQQVLVQHGSTFDLVAASRRLHAGGLIATETATTR